MASSSANSCASSSSAFSSRPSSITHLPVAVISPNAPWPSLPTDQQLKVRPLHHNNHNHNNFYSESSSAHSSLQSAGQHNTRPLLLTDGQHRASWANLLVDIVDSRLNKTPSKSAAEIGNGGKLGFLQPTTFDAPPPYDQLHGNNVGGQQLGAYRQYSNASAGTETSSGPFSVSKGSNSFFNFRFGEPGGHHFPLGQARPPSTVAIPPMATALRAGSALSSGGHPGSGGGSSAGAGSSRRSLQARSRATDNKRDRMQELRDLWARPGCRLCCLLLFLLLIGLIVAAVLLNNHLALPQHLEFAWFAPEQLRSTGSSSISNAAGGAATPQSGPNRGRLDVGQLGQQVRLELSGAPPFRSNFISVFDFKTNQVAIVDLSLRSGQRNLVCFVVDLDRQNIHDMEAMLRAAKAGASRRNQLYGWEESWTWVPNPLSQSPIFQPEVAECRGARWVKLTRAGADQKGQKCSECFDFCLPDWGIQRDAIRDEDYLNILRRLCFSLFVPEWRPFAQSLSWQQNQHDFEQFYRGQQQFTTDLLQQQQQNAQKASQQTGGSETKWISLQTPQQQQSPTFGSAGPSQPQQPQQQQWPFQQSFAGTAAGQFPASSAVLSNVKSAASEQLQQQLPYLLPSASSWAQQQQPAIWPSISNQQQPQQQQPTINNQQQSGLLQLNSGQQSGQMPLQQQQPSAAGVQQQPANGQQQQQPSDTAQQQQWPQMQPQHPTVNGGEGQQQQQQKWLR